MWRPWDTETEEEQQLDKSASEGIAVLASNSDDSVVFVAEHPSPSILWPSQVFEGLRQVPCLPFQVHLVHPLVSTQFFLVLFFLSNIITVKFVTR